MSKSGKKGENAHVSKADVRHKFQVKELEDYSRRETNPDGSEHLMPRVAVLTPIDGGKQVRAYVPGNLTEPLEVGSIVMCRPHEQHSNAEGPPIKFRITNVVDTSAESGAMTSQQNAEFAGRTPSGSKPMGQREAARR